MGRCALKDHAQRSQANKMSFKSQNFLFPTLSLDLSAFSGTDLFDGGMCTFWGGRFVIPQGSKSVKAPMSGCQAMEPSSFQPLLRQVESGQATCVPKTQILIQEAGSQSGENNGREVQNWVVSCCKISDHTSAQSASHSGLVIWRTGWTATTQQSLPGFPKPSCSSYRVKQGTKEMSWSGWWCCVVCFNVGQKVSLELW